MLVVVDSLVSTIVVVDFLVFSFLIFVKVLNVFVVFFCMLLTFTFLWKLTADWTRPFGLPIGRKQDTNLNGAELAEA